MPRKIILTDEMIKAFETTPCPKCGNGSIFTAHSQQVCEDGCEVWVECGQCGYDPTIGKPLHRMESVMGGTTDENVIIALTCWDDAIDA